LFNVVVLLLDLTLNETHVGEDGNVAVITPRTETKFAIMAQRAYVAEKFVVVEEIEVSPINVKSPGSPPTKTMLMFRTPHLQ
jgi:hypothetical protein